jgi:tetratricopeptide (TPR) repeat protein
MLNLVDQLLALGRKLQKLGRDADAYRILTRLSGFRDLPPEVAEEAQTRRAEILLRRRRPVHARRLLASALLRQPDVPQYHFLMATALSTGPHSDPQRAHVHYRRCLELDPAHPRYLCHYGLSALRLGESENGLTCLRRAVELAPDNPEVVGKLADGLSREGRFEEARSALCIALFRHPRDRRFCKLWQRFRFQELRRSQLAARRSSRAAQTQEGPRLLPFVRLTPSASERPGTRLFRRDSASALPSPHLSRPLQFPGQRPA